VQRTPMWPVLSEAGVGLLLSFLLWFAARHLAWFAANFSQNSLIALAILVCWVLYLIRQNFRIAYSSVELGIGVLAIIGAVGRAPVVVPDEPTGDLLLLQLVAGIYIVIRGFDNFGAVEVFCGRREGPGNF
jgi:hypothetical protein